MTRLHAERLQGTAQGGGALEQLRERQRAVVDRAGQVVAAAADDVVVEDLESQGWHQRPSKTGGRFSARASAASRTSRLAQTAANDSSTWASSARPLRTSLL